MSVFGALPVFSPIKNFIKDKFNSLAGDNSKDFGIDNVADSRKAAVKSETTNESVRLPSSIRWLSLEQEILCQLECGRYGTPQRNLICSQCRLLISVDITVAKKSKGRYSQKARNRVTDEIFLSSLKDIPNSLAHEISMRTEDAIEEIFQIVPSLSAKSYAFEDISERVQLLYKDIGKLISSVKMSKSMRKKISTVEILRRVEECVCHRTYSVLFCMSAAEKAAEIAHSDWIKSWNFAKDHCLPSAVSSDSANFQAYVHDAGRALSEMNSFCTPTEKLDCVVRCANCIYLAIRENSDESLLISPDVLVAGLIYAILQENPDLLQANLEFISKFGQTHAVGDQGTGYSFTLVCVAMHFVIDGIAETSLIRWKGNLEKTPTKAISQDRRLLQEFGNLNAAQEKGKKVEDKLIQIAETAKNLSPTKEKLVIDHSAETKIPNLKQTEPASHRQPLKTEKETLKSEESGNRATSVATVNTSANIEQPLKTVKNDAPTPSEEKLQMSRIYDPRKSDVSQSQESKNVDFPIRPIRLKQQTVNLPKLEVSKKTATDDRASNATKELTAEPPKTKVLSEKTITDHQTNMQNNLSNTERIAKDVSREVPSAKMAKDVRQEAPTATIAKEDRQEVPSAKIKKEVLQEVPIARITKDVSHAVPTVRIAKEVRQEVPTATIIKEVRQEVPSAKIAKEVQQEVSSAKITKVVRQEVPSTTIIKEVHQEVPTAEIPPKLVESTTLSPTEAVLPRILGFFGIGAKTPLQSPADEHDSAKKQDKFDATKDVNKGASAVKTQPHLEEKVIVKEVLIDKVGASNSGAQNLPVSSGGKDSTSKKLHNLFAAKESKDTIVNKEVASTNTPSKSAENTAIQPLTFDTALKEKRIVPDSRVQSQPKISSDKDDSFKKVEVEPKRIDDKQLDQNADTMTDVKRKQFIIRAPIIKLPPAAPPTWSVAPPDNSLGSLKTATLTTESTTATTMAPAIATTSTVPTTNETAIAAALAVSSVVPSLAESLSSWRPIAMRRDSDSGLENQENSPALAFTREFLTRPKNMVDIVQDRRRVEVPTVTQPKTRTETDELAGIDTKLLFEQALKFSEAHIAQEKLRQAEQGSGQSQPPLGSSKGMMQYLSSTDDSPAKKTKIVIKVAENSENTNNATGKQMSPKDALLRWCQLKTKTYPISITNFSGSWADGMAFCALVHHFCPTAFDFAKLQPQDRRHNFELAFRTAERQGIDRLLEVDDMIEMGDRPDWKCVFTYVQAIYRRFRNEN